MSPDTWAGPMHKQSRSGLPMQPTTASTVALHYTCHAILHSKFIYGDRLLIGVCGNPILQRIVDSARKPSATVLRRGTSRMNTADIGPSPIGDTASALPASCVDGIAKPVRTAGRYRSRGRPHRAKSLVTRVASNRMGPPRVYAPARIPTMRSRT